MFMAHISVRFDFFVVSVGKKLIQPQRRVWMEIIRIVLCWKFPTSVCQYIYIYIDWIECIFYTIVSKYTHSHAIGHSMNVCVMYVCSDTEFEKSHHPPSLTFTFACTSFGILNVQICQATWIEIRLAKNFQTLLKNLSDRFGTTSGHRTMCYKTKRFICCVAFCSPFCSIAEYPKQKARKIWLQSWQ